MSTTPTTAAPREDRLEDRRLSLGKYVKRMSSVFKREKSTKSLVVAAASPPPASSAAQGEQPRLNRAVAAEDQVAPPPITSPAPPTAHPPADSPATKQLDRHAMQQERARALFAKYGLTLDPHDWITPAAPCPTVQRVEKAIRMRVHRSCHRCGSMYGADKTCQQCDHKRCKKCPRYPKKKTAGAREKEGEKEGEKDKDKDAVDKVKRRKVLTITTRSGSELAYQPPKQRIRRTCHKCHTLFSPSTATVCDSCNHVRCTTCPREPAKLTKWPAGYPGDVDPDSDSEVEKQLDKFRRTWRKPRTRVRWQCDKCYTLFLNHSPQCPGCGHERCDNCTRSPTKKTKNEEQFDPHIVAAVEAKLRALTVDDSHTSGTEVT
ncbi:hypothetical protein T440DRAFT_484012 [Plenodomus tracheiphilus IPT5]|uniref:Uncharacterized protein n=1 Tax=Plenodomus tracheiphilus IPT5 TaxID=1408161 RepID=A0A6A7AR55_9PLEO|nr:hypothetical protein T440DRAFT_484012 [Plenodomus tracheiphilus IPT5]